MPQVSRNKLDHKDEEKLLLTLHLILAHIGRREQMKDFSLSFLTPTEQLMFAKWLAIVLLLKEGQEDNDIATLLHVTRPTVAKLRYSIDSQGKGYEVAFTALQNEKVRQEITATLAALGRYAAAAVGGRTKPTIF